MSDSESESLVSSIEQLQQHQKVLAKYMAGMKRQLDNLSEQFNNRSELKQIANLQDALAQLQLDKRSLPELPTKTDVTTWVDEQQPVQVQSSEYQLVFDRSGSRDVLIEALEKTQKRLIIVCPWLNRNSIDSDLLQKFRDCLNRNCCIDVGWGHLSDGKRLGKGWQYNALSDLRQLERDYPDLFRLKLLGTHEKFLVCDSSFAMLGSHNLLTSSAQSAEREIGIRTTDAHIIQGLITRFDSFDVQNTQLIDQSLTEDFVSLNDTEALEQDISGESDTILVNPDDSTEDEPGTAVNTEELLRRYEAGERNFAEINLAGANLIGVSLNAINLSKANLTRAKLSNTNLIGVNLSEANLIGVNLTGANLMSAELSAANLSGAKLAGANLNAARFVQANLQEADLNGANLNYTNLSAASFTQAS